jgi:hypothetical protein
MGSVAAGGRCGTGKIRRQLIARRTIEKVKKVSALPVVRVERWNVISRLNKVKRGGCA